MNKRFSLKNLATDLFIYTGILSIVYLLGGPIRYKPADVSLINSGFKEKTIEKKVERNVDYKSMSLEEVIEFVKTPEQAQDYLNKLDVDYLYYTQENSGISSRLKKFYDLRKEKSFRGIHSLGEASCLGHSLAAAALLKDNGYSSVLMFFESEGFAENPVVYLYKEKGKFGALGTTPLKPEFDTLSEVKEKIR